MHTFGFIKIVSFRASKINIAVFNWELLITHLSQNLYKNSTSCRFPKSSETISFPVEPRINVVLNVLTKDRFCQ